MAKQQEMTDADAFRMLGEKLKISAIRPNVYGYQPHTKQQRFHQSTAKKRLYIGGNRSGKTTGGIVEDIWHLTGRHPYIKLPPPPIRGRIVSVDFLNGIEKIILPELARWLPPSDLRGGSWSTAYDKQLRTLHLENGSFVELMSYDQDLDKFAGTSRHFVHFDEEPPQDIYQECLMRILDTGGYLWFTMTPVEGMTWIYDTIYEPGMRGEDGIEVIVVDTSENPHLNATEVELAFQGLNDEEVAARKRGEFVQLGGLIYKNFDPKPGGAHVLKEPWLPYRNGEIQDGGPYIIVASLDHGWRNPTAWLWHAVNTEGYAITFHEHYFSERTVDWHAKQVHQYNQEVLGREPDFYIGDPSIVNKSAITGTSVHEEYLKAGIAIIEGNNAVRDGIIRVQRYMQTQVNDQGVTSPPLWHITPNCVNTIKEAQRYRWKVYANKKLNTQNNPQEEPHKKDDHAMDSLRYFLMSRPDLRADRPEPPMPARNHMDVSTAIMPNQVVTPEFIDQTIGSSNDTEWAYDEYVGTY